MVGVVVLVLLSVPMALKFGNEGGRNYGWYTTADGNLQTGLILDQVQYTRLTDSTAGRAPSSEVAPFTSRALAPWLGGKLPLDASTALTVVNLSSLIAGTFALALLAKDLTRRREAILVAVLIWAVSFPVLKYTGAAFVDPAAVGLVPCVLLAIWRRKTIVALLLFAAAIWMKETSLVLLPVAFAFEWTRPGAGRGIRVLRTAMWLLVAAIAYVTAHVPGGDHLIVFAPWVPESRVTIERMVLFNITTPARFIAYGLTVLPAVFAVTMWWRRRGTANPVLPESDALPLVIGCAAGALVGLSAMPTAVMDGRSVWTTLPMAALLTAGWVATGTAGSALTDVRRFARASVIPVGIFMVLWITAIVVAPPPTGSEVLTEGYRPRFTAVPTEPETSSTAEYRGEAGSSIDIPGSDPVLIEFESSAPISLSTDNEELVKAGRSTRGVALFDPVAARTLDVSAEGTWRILVRPVSSALFWEQISPLSGTGPNVLVFPGGLPLPIEVSWTSDDPSDRIRLVGGCHLGSCGEVEHDGVIPAGTEALVIDASGKWSLVPGYQAEDAETEILPDTRIVGTQGPS